MRLPSEGIGFSLAVLAVLATSGLTQPAWSFDFIDESSPELLAMLPPIVPPPIIKIDRSGRRQQGQASYYAKSFQNKKMANGQPFKMNSNIAASKSLPIGTIARVTNLKNGKSAVVTIQDRGPFHKDRVVDLTPHTAAKLDLQHDGVIPVIVSPISVPQRDGTIKLGAGAAPSSRLLDEDAAIKVKAGLQRRQLAAKPQRDPLPQPPFD